jgi:hypothetical protein
MKLTERDLDIAEASRFPSGEPEAAVRWPADFGPRLSTCNRNCVQGRACDCTADVPELADPDEFGIFRGLGWAVASTAALLAVCALVAWALPN